MATCRATIKRTLRKLGKLAAGREARSEDATDALESLKGLYRSLINSGAFGRLNDVVPTADYIAGSNERVFRYNDDVLSISIPALVDAGGENLPPIDCSVIVIVDAHSGATQEYIYDAHLRQWSSIGDLELDSYAPLSHRDPDGLSAMLAMQIADEYGGDISAATGRLAAAFQSTLTHRFSSPANQVASVFY